MFDHSQHRTKRIECIFGGSCFGQYIAGQTGVAWLLQMGQTSVAATLYHRTGKEAGINSQPQRQSRYLKRPEGKPCLMQARQHGHAANRARAHRSRASYLEGRLGAESLVGIAGDTTARRALMAK